MNYEKLLDGIKTISLDAGKAILEVYHRDEDLDITTKDNDSPLTEADLTAHRIIVEALYELTPGLPVLSEESKIVSWQERQSWETYWLVDPLDGTKEFISRNGQHCAYRQRPASAGCCVCTGTGYSIYRKS